MNQWNKYLLFFWMTFAVFTGFATPEQVSPETRDTTTQINPVQIAKPEMADALRESGKIYVVVIVLSLIFTGIIVYLWMIDRKVSRLEDKSKGK